jgi:uncharacterized protein YjbI with pentapeptide repeats
VTASPYPAAPIAARWSLALILVAFLAVGGWSIASLPAAAARHPVDVDQPRVAASSARADGLGALRRVPVGAQSQISSALGAADAQFAPGVRPGGFALQGGEVAAELDARGASFVAGGRRASVDLVGIGRAGQLRPVIAAAPRASGGRVVYERGGGVLEWYRAGPLGVEQGFRLARRPSGAAGAVTLALALGGLRGRLTASEVDFLTGSGRVALRYGGLVATDARGRRLPAWLSLSGSRLLLRTDDRGARYPLTIDPFVQQGSKLTTTGETGPGELGSNVALSSDGNTALIGAPDDNGNVGAAWVFTRSGSTWTQQGSKLTTTDETGKGELGSSVALSSDGNTALIGAPDNNAKDDAGENGDVGAAWVFTRSGSTWTQQGSRLAPNDAAIFPEFGSSVALSHDGNTALIGGPDNYPDGASWVFTRSGATWTQQGPRLTPNDASGAQAGSSVALSADGNTALVGGPAQDAVGAVWMFTRSGSTWAQQGSKVPAPPLTSGGAEFGASVALSADGQTAAIGAPAESGNVGAVWEFARSGSTWTQQGLKTTANDESGAGQFGASVALSGDGQTALIGGPTDGNKVGAAWVAGLESVQCLRQAAAPPPAPPGGVILARPLSSTPTGPNVVVIPAGASWTPAVCDGSSVVSAPATISVGAGAALVFKGPSWVTSWGAVDVGAGDPAPNIDPGGPSHWKPTEVDVIKQVDSLDTYQSCRDCNLPGVTYDGRVLNIPGASQSFLGDVSGANLSGAQMTGGDLSAPIFSLWTFNHTNLTGANLDRAFFLDSTMDGAIVDGTKFDGASFPGTRISALQFKVPPTFSGISIGNGGIESTLCTTFQDTNLWGATFTLRQPNEAECSTTPLFPGSRVPTSWITALASKSVDLGDAQFVSDGGNALAGADLHGIDLDKSSFVGTPADLEKTNFNGASLAGTSFRLADLEGATFANATAPGAVFADADLEGASFAGPKTSLTGANFVRADLDGASFQSADLSRAAFDDAMAMGADFNSVVAVGTVFSGAHIYGDGQAFDGARDLSGADFSDAVLAGDLAGTNRFDLTDVKLKEAKFDDAQCVACNFTGSTLTDVVFSRAYLPGAVFSGAQDFSGVDMTSAWLYCGDKQNSACAQDTSHPGDWDWKLVLGVGEIYGPVPFANTDLTGVSLQDVIACPDGLPPSGTDGCAGHLLPAANNAPPIPARCSAAGREACPTPTSTLPQKSSPSPLAVTAATPATWASTVTESGYYAAEDDGTIQQVGAGAAQTVAGQAGQHCAAPTSTCGDGGPASSALLGRPTGLAVGLDGSLYVADPSLHRVRRIDLPVKQDRGALGNGQISTIAGSGAGCTSTAPAACGDGGPATAAALAGPYGVWATPVGDVYIADGLRGIREVHADGTITAVGPPPGKYDIRDVTGDGHGDLFATTHNPDYLIEVQLSTGQTTVVVGTGTSGYNGNSDPNFGTLLPGDEVQVDDPQSVAVALDGNVVFADTGNNLIRAYVPDSGHVIDDLGGVVTGGVPQGGDNGDGHYATATELSHPAGVAVTTGPLLIVADSGNNKVRQLGPGPINTGRLGGTPPPSLAQLDCTTTTHRRGTPTAHCTLSAFHKKTPLPALGAPQVKIFRWAAIYATGRGAHPGASRFQLVIKRLRRLTYGRYGLLIKPAGRHAGRHARVRLMVIIIQPKRTHAR